MKKEFEEYIVILLLTLCVLITQVLFQIRSQQKETERKKWSLANLILFVEENPNISSSKEEIRFIIIT